MPNIVKVDNSLLKANASLVVANRLLAKSVLPELIPYRSGRKWGFCDRNKRIVIDCIYDDCRPFNINSYCRDYGEIARVKLGNKSFFITKNETPRIYIYFSMTDYFDNRTDNKDEVHIYIHEQLDWMGSFSEGLLEQQGPNEKWGFVDEENNTVIPGVYDEVTKFSDGLAGVKKNGKWGFIDKTGSQVITHLYDNTGMFSEGLAFVAKEKKYGFIDKFGHNVIPFIYDRAWGFSEGLALTNLKDVFCFINKRGATVIEIPHQGEASSFNKGLAEVHLTHKHKLGYIDKMGTRYWED